MHITEAILKNYIDPFGIQNVTRIDRCWETSSIQGGTCVSWIFQDNQQVPVCLAVVRVNTATAGDTHTQIRLSVKTVEQFFGMAPASREHRLAAFLRDAGLPPIAVNQQLVQGLMAQFNQIRDFNNGGSTAGMVFHT